MRDWNQWLFDHAALAATASQNRKAKVGATLYDPTTHRPLLSNFNDLTRGMEYANEALHEKPLKGLVWAHAERKTICLAARMGLPTNNMGMAVNWYPCAACAQAIVDAGIVELIGEEPDMSDESWAEDFKAAKLILKKAEVRQILLPPTRWKKPPDPAAPAKKTGIILPFPGSDTSRLAPSTSPLQPISP